ncbi:MAG: sugar transferase [Acidobacteriia bacterium]|nr:sugar transferase [Terriglobia bacterium]
MTRRLAQFIFVADLLVVGASLFLAYYVRSLAGPSPGTLAVFIAQWWPMILSAIGLWTILYIHMKLDGFRGGWHLPRLTSQLTLAVFLLITLLLAVGYLQHQFYYSRLALLSFGFLVLVGFILVRCCVRSLVMSKTRSGGSRKVVILGNGNVARELAHKIEQHPELLLQVVGFLYPGTSESMNGAAAILSSAKDSQPVTSLGVVDLFRASQVEELIVALPDSSALETRKLIAVCRSEGFHVSLIPQWYELYVSRARLVELDGLPMISLENRSLSPVSLLYKRTMDLVLASFLVLLASPLLLVIAASLLVRRGKIFKFEVRCGENGKPFRMYRFNVDREHPDRLIGFERLLAQLSLTELPQLWNVLLGDMALVGPRPESPDRVRHYSDWQKQRLTITPGLTGLAQVYGLRDRHSSEAKARFDVQYIYDWSPLLDLSLVLQTVWTLAVRLFHPDRAVAQVPPVVAPGLTEVMRANRTHSGAD